MLDQMKVQTIDGTRIHSDNKIRVGRRIHGSGTITRTWNQDDADFVAPTKQMCGGCTDDFYNDHNPYGVKQCWMFPKAVVVNKVGYSSIHCANGPDTLMVKTLSCWHAVSK